MQHLLISKTFSYIDVTSKTNIESSLFKENFKKHVKMKKLVRRAPAGMGCMLC